MSELKQDPRKIFTILEKNTVGFFNETKKISIQEFDDYTYCQKCHNPLPHCHCKCPYCSESDGCECALFDAATGG